jgi:hypothetical protein
MTASAPGLYRYQEEIAAQGRPVIRRNEPLTILTPPVSEV